MVGGLKILMYFMSAQSASNCFIIIVFLFYFFYLIFFLLRFNLCSQNTYWTS